VTPEQREDIKLLIAVYEEHGCDWSTALEYTVRKYHGTLPHQERWPWDRKIQRKRKVNGQPETGEEMM
jgi:hypothetical protein